MDGRSFSHVTYDAIRELAVSNRAKGDLTISLSPAAHHKMGDGYRVDVLLRAGAGGWMIEDTVETAFAVQDNLMTWPHLDKLLEVIKAFSLSDDVTEFCAKGAENEVRARELVITDHSSPNLLHQVNFADDVDYVGDIARINDSVSHEAFDVSVMNCPFGVLVFEHDDFLGNQFKILIASDANWDRLLFADPGKPWMDAFTGGGFRNPTGVAWANWRFYVADTYNDRVRQYRVHHHYDDEPTIEQLADFPADSGIHYPIDVAAGLYFTDEADYTICAVLNQGDPWHVVRLFGDGVNDENDEYPVDLYSEGGHFYVENPTAFAFGRHPINHHTTQRLYIADNYFKRVMSFVTKAPAPAGGYPDSTDWDVFPDDACLSSVAVDNAGCVWVVDQKHCKVYKFSADLELVGTYGEPGAGDGQLCYPQRLACSRRSHDRYDWEQWRYYDLGDVVVSELWNRHTGLRRLVQGVDILDRASRYQPKFNGWGTDYVELKWFQTGLARAQMTVYYIAPDGLIPVHIQPPTLFRPGEQSFAWDFFGFVDSTYSKIGRLALILTVTSAYAPYGRVVCWDTVVFNRNAIGDVPCPCPIDMDSVTIISADGTDLGFADRMVWVSPDNFFRAELHAHIWDFCGNGQLGPYTWFWNGQEYVDDEDWYTWFPHVDFYTDTTSEQHFHRLTTTEPYVWFKIPHNPVGRPNGAGTLGDSPGPVPFWVRVGYDTASAGAKGSDPESVDWPCGFAAPQVVLWWSFCQSPFLADSTCADVCCTGWSVGNVDESTDHLVTMSDLTVLLDHLFQSMAPLQCSTQGNCDMSADGEVTMGDLTVLVDHLFINFEPLPPCPH